MLYPVVANNRREAMTRKLWKRALMVLGAITTIGVASAASAAPAKAQPPVVVVRPYGYPYGYGYGPRVVVVGHPYWHNYRWYDYRFREWRFRREWR